MPASVTYANVAYNNFSGENLLVFCDVTALETFVVEGMRR
jgi:hypothetical protein